MKARIFSTVSRTASLAGIALAAACTTAPLATQGGKTARSVAAVQGQVTPFTAIGSQIEMASFTGGSYLSFMQTQVKPALDSYETDIQSVQKGSNYEEAILTLLAEGKGVGVRIDPNNYILNVGYLNGSNPNDVKSGRSFGVGPEHRQSDPSDLFYLNELQALLASSNPLDVFYQALMDAITACDGSSWSKMSTQGQTVATDFMAIYTAESDRHIMVHLEPDAHPWEIDLAAATVVSALDVKTGKMMKGGKIVEGPISGWWQQGKEGSGIGETRADRELLQKKIGAFETQHHPELIQPIERIIGEAPGGDVIQATFVYLSGTQTPKSLGGSAQQLSNAFVAFLMQAVSDADQILSD